MFTVDGVINEDKDFKENKDVLRTCNHTEDLNEQTSDKDFKENKVS